MERERSCLDCTFVDNCSHAQKIALKVVKDVKDLGKGMYFFTFAAASCKMFPKDLRQKRTKDRQLPLFSKEVV